MFAVALLPLVATLGDPGITWDEPVYRESQRLQAEWFSRLARARSWNDVRELVSREATHDLWMSARYGLNFHPPLAGMLSNLTHLAFGHWLHDLNARRLASALELAAGAALLFHFLGRRCGVGVAAVSGLSLVLMPRVFGHAHVAGTDMPMLFFWAATAMAFWKGQSSRPWRVAFAALLALAFLVKLSTVFVLFPLLVWQAIYRSRPDEDRPRLERASDSPASRPAPLLSRFVVVLALATPLVLAGWESHRLAEGMRLETQGRLLPYAAEKYFQNLDLLEPGVSSPLPGWILLIPVVMLTAFWISRSAAMRIPGLRPWFGPVGPAFEMLVLSLAVGPAVVLGLNPGWWRDTLVRIGHYFALFLERRAALPEIEILYLGQKYVYSLPWHNGWVLTAVTVPLGILLLAAVGSLRAIRYLRRDPLPMFFLLNAAALPASRMLPTPAHDGVRLMLPTFFFLAGLAGIGYGWLADRLTGQPSANGRGDPSGAEPRKGRIRAARLALAALALGPAAFDLARIHPYELSYYNRAVGGLAGATRRGFEVTYWYDAVTPDAIADINRRLPPGARIEIPVHTDVFGEWQDRGHPRLRSDITLHGATAGPRFVFLLTHSSKSNPTTRLLFAQRPAFPPVEHAGVRLFSIYDEPAITTAQALALLAGAQSERAIPGRDRLEPPSLSTTVLEIAKRDPDAVLAAAKLLADGGARLDPPTADPSEAAILREVLSGNPNRIAELRRFAADLTARNPQAFEDAARILVEQPDRAARLIRAEGYLPTEAAEGYLDAKSAP
jgi:hypothetical protein